MINTVIRKSALIVFAGLVFGAVPADAMPQDETPTFTTDDIKQLPFSVTTVNAEADAKAKADSDAAAQVAAAQRGVAEGYVRFAGPRKYSFERPAEWQAVELKASPGALTLDASFQDPATGSVITAISAERADAQSAMDITKQDLVNGLLGSMLNPGNAAGGIKIVRQTSGTSETGLQWLRIKAEGTGQTTDGKTVKTTYWVQMIQTSTRFALVAAGYPSTQPAAAEQAFHTVRTLEFDDVPGLAASGNPDNQPGSPAKAPSEKKNRAGGVRRQ